MTTCNTIVSPAASFAPRSSLAKRAIRASVWTFAAYGFSQALRLGSNIILARLLFPEAFGIMSLIQVMLQGLHMFSDLGIGLSIIREKRDDERFLNTAWTLQIVRGVLLWLGFVGLAIPVAWFYGVPELRWMLPVAGFTALINGTASMSLFTENKKLAMGRLTLITLASQAISLTIVVMLAWQTRSVWSLVIGGVIGALLPTLASHLVLPGIRHRFCWDRQARSSLFHFGKWIFVSSVLGFLAMQLDRLLLGKLVPLEILGIYAIALSLARLPFDILSKLVSGVVFPVLAERSRSDPTTLGPFVLKLRRRLLPIGVLISVTLALCAPAFFRLAYDPRYASAAWMSQLLAIYVWFCILQVSVDQMLLALGDSRATCLSTLANVLVTAVGCFLGYQVAGMPGFIIGLCFSSLAGHLVVVVALHRHGVHIVRQDLTYTAIAVGAALAGMLGGLAVRHVAPAAFVTPLDIGALAIVIASLSLWGVQGARADGQSHAREIAAIG